MLDGGVIAIIAKHVQKQLKGHGLHTSQKRTINNCENSFLVSSERLFTSRIERASKATFGKKLASGKVEEITMEDIQEVMCCAAEHAKAGVKSRLLQAEQFDTILTSSNPFWESERSPIYSEPNSPLTPVTPRKVSYLVDDDPDFVNIDWLLELLKYILGSSHRSVEVLERFFQPRPDGYVSRRKVFSALQVPAVVKHLKSLQEDRQTHAPFLVHRRPSHTAVGAITRDFLIKTITEQAQRDDSMKALIVTTMQTMVFVGVIITHLQVWSRHNLTKSLTFALSTPSPELKDVNSMPSFVSWLNQTGFKALFHRVRPSRREDELRAALASSNFLIGDAQLRWRSSGTEASRWLLKDAPGQPQYLQNHKGEYLTAARATLAEIWTPEWVESLDSLSWVFCTYNDRAQMYSLNKVQLSISQHQLGPVYPRLTTTAVLVNAYPNKPLAITMDTFYLLFIVTMLIMEGREVATALLAGGCRAVREYFTFSNAIDWCNIFVGCCACAIWICCCLAMRADSLRALLDGDLRTEKVMGLEPEQILAVERDVEQLMNLFVCLHMLAAVNVFSIMSKFYKGFHVNPRLELVILTLKTSFVPIVHFLIIFLTVCIAGSIVGHVLFGSDLREFYSMDSSLRTVGLLILGEAGWYSLALSDDLLPSGTPKIVLTIWYITCVLLIVLVLTNMLLASLMLSFGDAYAKTLEGHQVQNLWTDFREYLHRRRMTRHVKLDEMVVQLGSTQRKSKRLFPHDIVDLPSMNEAFPAMPLEQAVYIMSWLARERRKQTMAQADAQAATPLDSVFKVLQRVAAELHPVSTRLSTLLSRIGDIEVKLHALKDQRRRQSLGPFVRRKKRRSSSRKAPQKPPEMILYRKELEGRRIFRI